VYTYHRPRILLVCGVEEEAHRLKGILDGAGYLYRHTVCGGPDLKAVEEDAPDLVLMRTCGTGKEGLCTLAQAPSTRISPEYVVLGPEEALETAVLAIRLGAFDFLRSTVGEKQLLGCIRRALERRSNLRYAGWPKNQKGYGSELGMIGSSPGMNRIWNLVLRVAPTSATVLLTGETGTGKEVAARAIHQLSTRKDGPWVPVSCAALPEHLLESELFGHRKGSFTGAVSDSPGLLERASGGTVFLDEVETLTLTMQGKLLRAVEERTIQRVGSRHDIPVDFRLIAATNDCLADKVRDGSFREDLYFRLSVFPIEIPPLRFRLGDIPLLVDHFCAEMAREAGVPIPEVSRSTMNRLMEYAWPGNVRELKHCVERSFILCGDLKALDIDVPPGGPAGQSEVLQSCLGFGWDLERLEEEYIRAAIRRTNGHRNRAAEILGIDRRTLYRKLKKIELES